MQKTTMHRKENELSVSSATSVARMHTSKYLSGPNRTDRILLVYSSGVRLKYSTRFLYVIAHISLNIHAVQHLHVYAPITSDLYR